MCRVLRGPLGVQVCYHLDLLAFRASLVSAVVALRSDKL